MDTQTFPASVQTLLRRQPFHPFTVALENGDRLEVDHPQAIAFNSDLCVHAGPAGVPAIFNTDAVSDVVGDLARPGSDDATPAAAPS